jgi:hypothetical protein
MKPSLVPYEDYLEVRELADRAIKYAEDLMVITKKQHKELRAYERKQLPFTVKVLLLAVYTFVLIRFM